MLLKQKSDHYPIFIAIVLTTVFIVIAVKNSNILEFQSDLKESFLSYDPGFSVFPPLTEITNNLVGIARGIVLGFPDRPDFKTIYIDINPEEYRLILSDRERAIANNVLFNPTEVSAKLRFAGEQLRAKVRLKGDLSDHWLSKKRMSVRVELKNGNSILGFNEFSIQKPASRQHPYDAVFQALIDRTGNLSASHNYVNAVFNGDDWGVMVMEEAMSVEFLEKKEKKESLIVRFSNEEKGVIEMKSELLGIPLFTDYRLSDDMLFLKMYEGNKYAQNINFRKWYSYVAQERVAQNEYSTQLYNIDAYSQVLFMAAFWNDGHSLWHANSRHYFNPYTLKLEPITTDAYLPFSIRTSKGLFPRIGFNPLLKNSVYNYIYSTDLFRKNFDQNFEIANKAILYAKSYYEKFHQYFPLDPVEENFLLILADNIQILNIRENREALFSPKDLIINTEVVSPSHDQQLLLTDHVHIRHFEDGKVELYNLLPGPVKVTRIVLDNDKELILNIQMPPYQPGKYQAVSVQTAFEGFLDNRVAVETEYLGEMRMTASTLSLAVNDMHNPLLKEEPKNLEFLHLISEDQWEFLPGNWEINEPIVIKGNLRIHSGTSLRFNEDAYLVVMGAVEAIGTEAEPINFEAMNQNQPWKGIYIYEADTESVFRFVSVRDYTALEDGLLSLTGGLTFYNSDVVLEDVSLIGAKGEDALNIVESNFKISNLFIANAASDGFDSDFSDGVITDSRFIDINGDAIDFSGSTVILENIYAENIFDKVVSVGEASEVRITGGIFKNVGIGVVSKDGSLTIASNLQIESFVLAAAMAYEKKSFYSKPTLEMSQIETSGEAPFIRQIGSHMTLDGREIFQQAVNVDDLYENTVMKK